MLNDRKSERFVHDFLDQWLRLKELNATSPDEYLYPEFDELLPASDIVRRETNRPASRQSAPPPTKVHEFHRDRLGLDAAGRDLVALRSVLLQRAPRSGRILGWVTARTGDAHQSCANCDESRRQSVIESHVEAYSPCSTV